MKKFPVHILILLLTFASCQREDIVDLDIPQKRKLVSAMFIGTGETSVAVMLTQSTPVIGTAESMEPIYVPNARGTFRSSASSASWPLTYDSIFRYYTANLDPEEIRTGQHYRIEFSDEYENIHGNTIIPQPVKTAISLKLDSSVTPTDFAAYTAEISCTSLSEGLFHIRLIPVVVYSDSSTFPMSDFNFIRQNIPSVRKGQSFSQTFTTPVGFDFIYPVRIDVMVISCDEAYMKYYNSSGNMSFDQLSALTEPSIVYSNMSNNIGIIASYNVSEVHSAPVK